MKDRLSIGVLVVLGIAAAYLYARGAGEHELVGQPAPGLDLPLLDGGRMNLADHLGEEIVLLDFWASWCPPCRKSMPAVAEVAREYADKGVVLYAVNEGEPAEIARDYIENAHLDITVALDTAWQAGRDYLVEGIPQLVIIDKDGTIAKVHVGAGPGLKNQLREELDALLSAGNQPTDPPAR